MKKINKLQHVINILVVLLFITIATMVALTSCNQQILDTTYTFNKAYITIGNETIKVDVKSWKDYDDSDQIQVETKDGTVYFGHASNIILVKEK
jgi:major membrane immunogen (membrane-anchored lipoprotein)